MPYVKLGCIIPLQKDFFLTQKAKDIGPGILEFADELDAALRQPFNRQEMAGFEKVLRALAETQENI